MAGGHTVSSMAEMGMGRKQGCPHALKGCSPVPNWRQLVVVRLSGGSWASSVLLPGSSQAGNACSCQDRAASGSPPVRCIKAGKTAHPLPVVLTIYYVLLSGGGQCWYSAAWLTACVGLQLPPRTACCRLGRRTRTLPPHPCGCHAPPEVQPGTVPPTPAPYSPYSPYSNTPEA